MSEWLSYRYHIFLVHTCLFICTGFQDLKKVSSNYKLQVSSGAVRSLTLTDGEKQLKASVSSTAGGGLEVNILVK